MFKQIKEFFFGTPKETVKKDETKVEAVNAAPYKVEAPVVAKAAPAVTAPAKSTKPKAPAKKRTFVKRDEKPAAIKAPAKPRAPRAPKAK